MVERPSICDYCKMVIQTEPTSCQACKKTLCIYHASQENHHCESVDWKGIREEKYVETKARFDKAIERSASERSTKALFKFLGAVLLIGVLWFFIAPAIKNVDFGKMLVFHTNSTPDEHNISILVFQYTNEERAKYNLSTFQDDPQLEASAEWQSECLSTNNILEHDSEQCGTLENRYARFGVHYLAAGENLALDWDARSYYEESEAPTGYLSNEEIAHTIVNGWMDSPGHRANILEGTFERMGVGVFYNRTSHKIITTQTFAG